MSLSNEFSLKIFEIQVHEKRSFQFWSALRVSQSIYYWIITHFHASWNFLNLHRIIINLMIISTKIWNVWKFQTPVFTPAIIFFINKITTKSHDDCFVDLSWCKFFPCLNWFFEKFPIFSVMSEDYGFLVMIIFVTRFARLGNLRMN